MVYLKAPVWDPLFLLYINDLSVSLKHCQETMYADYTAISFSTKNIVDLIATIKNDLASPEELLCGNKLSLNVLKAQAVMIGSKQKLSRCNHPKDTGVSIRINAD